MRKGTFPRDGKARRHVGTDPVERALAQRQDTGHPDEQLQSHRQNGADEERQAQHMQPDRSSARSNGTAQRSTARTMIRAVSSRLHVRPAALAE